MGHRGSQFNMPHTFTPDTRTVHRYPAAVTGDPFEFNSLVFTAVTFPVTHGPEDLFAKQAVFFGLEGAVINGFGFFNIAFRPGFNYLR